MFCIIYYRHGCVVLLCLVVCMALLASFILPLHLVLVSIIIIAYLSIDNVTKSCSVASDVLCGVLATFECHHFVLLSPFNRLLLKAVYIIQ